MHLTPDVAYVRGTYVRVAECGCGVVTDIPEMVYLDHPCIVCRSTVRTRYDARWRSTASWWRPLTWGTGYWERLAARRGTGFLPD